MKKNPIVGIKMLRFARSWKLILQYADGADIVSRPKTFLAALEAAKAAWTEQQPVRPERREIPVSCRPDSCSLYVCHEGCSQWRVVQEIKDWIRDHNAVRVGTSFVYEARR